jgi:hypothetical protein
MRPGRDVVPAAHRRSALLCGSEPAAECVASDDRDCTVRVDPVTVPQLTDEPERVAGPRRHRLASWGRSAWTLQMAQESLPEAATYETIMRERL